MRSLPSWILLCPLLMAGCLEAHSTRCLDLVCPEGLVCSAELTRCVRPEQIAACAGRADGEACSFTGEPTGFCHEGVCLSFDCGDGLVDGFEVCDDGNIFDGDGCSADCRSDESCGNGVIDGRLGERCDDGNTVDGDGCQADCSLPSCGDGVVDPGEACDDGNDDDGDGCNRQCTSNETCGNGVIDVVSGEDCDDGGTAAGDGCGASCRIEVCGNGVLDPGEVCDDGNLLGDDGCSPACSSDETCGNGIADFATGEQCDDGNARSHDGCSSQCAVELPIFTEREFDSRPGYKYASMVYDAAHDRLVVYGRIGPIGEFFPGTAVFNGVTWSDLRTTAEPPNRRDAVLVYDAARRHVILLGGRDPGPRPLPMAPPPPPGPVIPDEWILQGDRWVETTAADTPPLADAAGTYDAARAEVVVFGGESMGSVRNDTWVHDGDTWSLRTVASAPPARVHARMAYDTVRERVVLFGGETSDGTALNDTWEWDGVSWSETTPAAVPSARDAMTYDAARARVVLFGGEDRSPSDEVWEYDGVAWTQRSVTGPAARFGSELAFWPGLGVVLHAGTERFIGPAFRDTWVLDGSGWRERVTRDEPGRTMLGAAAFDTRERMVRVFGGMTPPPSRVPLVELWSYDLEWSLCTDVVPPPPGGLFSRMVDDRARARMVALRQGPSELETWVLENGWWRRLDTAVSPPTRRDYGLVYDSVREVVVLFGGSDGPTSLNDTWELVGDSWTERMTATSPSPRGGPLTAFDEMAGVLVLFGGRVGGGNLDDTWQYDGTDWTEVAPRVSPRGRGARGMDYYGAIGRVVIAGGTPGFNDVWSFDAAEPTWERIVVPQSFIPRAQPVVVADPERDTLIVALGDPTPTTHELRYQSETPDERCGSGMDDDGDGLTDCEDPDCDAKTCGPGLACLANACVCRGGSTERSCGNGSDDDCDGLVDCADPDCASGALCSAESDCSDGLDDDDDGPADCADPGCATMGTCEAFETSCGDGNDNDGDGRVDCGDPDCFLVACAQPS